MLKIVMDIQPAATPTPQASAPISNAPAQPAVPAKVPHAHKFILGYVLLIFMAAAVGGVYEWQQSKVKNLQSQLNSAKSEVANNTANVSTNNVSGQDFLYLNTYGLKIPLTKDIQDLYYVELNGANGNNELVFSTQSLANVETGCMAVPTNFAYSYESLSLDNKPPKTPIGGTPFGLVTVTKQVLPTSQIGSLDTDVGTTLSNSNGHYFYYKQAQGTCLATDSKGNVVSQTDSNLLASQLTSFLAAMKKIEPIN
jgi:hypothetical protein